MTEFGVWFCMTISRNQPDVFDQSTSNIEKSELSLPGKELFWAATWAISSKEMGDVKRAWLAKRSGEIPRSNKKMVLRQWNVEQKRTVSSWKNLFKGNTNATISNEGAPIRIAIFSENHINSKKKSYENVK